jgi:plasmid stability protein
MANMSLRGVDEKTAKRLKAEARRRGVSVNALILQFVRQGFGLETAEGRKEPSHELDALAGTWDEEETSAFLKSLSDFEQVDEALWK